MINAVVRMLAHVVLLVVLYALTSIDKDIYMCVGLLTLRLLKSSRPTYRGNTEDAVADLVRQHVPPTCRGNTDDAIVDLVRQHVPASSLSTRGGTELAFKLPRDDSSSFAALLSQLEGRKAELGVLSCGLSVTTLEEVFLKVSAGSEAALDQKQAAALTQPQPVSQNIYNS